MRSHSLGTVICPKRSDGRIRAAGVAAGCLTGASREVFQPELLGALQLGMDSQGESFSGHDLKT